MNAMVHGGDEVASIKHKVESIPLAMRNMGWTVSAELMERWLRSPSWRMPDTWRTSKPSVFGAGCSSHVDQTLVRMSWALGFARVREVLKELRPVAANAPAREELRKKLNDLPWGGSSVLKIGSTNVPALELEGLCQSNWKRIGEHLDTLDDLYGSLGRALMKVAITGEARKDLKTGRITLHADRAGFYIRDTYDFNGTQFLGTWTHSGVLTKTEAALNAALDGLVYRRKGKPIGNLFNHDFETYRRLTGFGGDFVIFSDVHWEPLRMSIELPG